MRDRIYYLCHMVVYVTMGLGLYLLLTLVSTWPVGTWGSW